MLTHLIVIYVIVIACFIHAIKSSAKSKGYTFIEYIKRNRLSIPILIIILTMITVWSCYQNKYAQLQYDEFYHDRINPSLYSARIKKVCYEITINDKKYDDISISGNSTKLKNYGEEGYLIFKNANSDTFYIKKDNHTKFFIIKKP